VGRRFSGMSACMFESAVSWARTRRPLSMREMAMSATAHKRATTTLSRLKPSPSCRAQRQDHPRNRRRCPPRCRPCRSLHARRPRGVRMVGSGLPEWLQQDLMGTEGIAGSEQARAEGLKLSSAPPRSSRHNGLVDAFGRATPGRTDSARSGNRLTKIGSVQMRWGPYPHSRKYSRIAGDDLGWVAMSALERGRSREHQPILRPLRRLP